MINIDTSVLLNYYNSKAGVGLTGLAAGSGNGAAGSGAKAKDPVPTAPWSNASTSPDASALAKSVLAGHKFIDVNAAQLDVKGASDDYKNLFALYSGLDAMEGLAEQAQAKNLSSLQLSQLQKTFAAGMKEITSFVGGLKLDQLQLTTGASLSSDKTTVGVPATNTTYVTRPIYTGDPTQEVPAFQGQVKFNISIKQVNSTKSFAIDLGDMGSTPRTLNNVVDYINSQLKAQGVLTKFGIQKQPNPERTLQVGGKTITLPATAASYALTVQGDTSEKVTFSADATAGAVYIAQTTGASTAAVTTTKKDPATGQETSTTTPANGGQQLFKLQTDTSATTDQPPAPVQPQGSTYNVDGRVFADTLDPNVTKVHQTVTGSDGSVYVLADVDGTIDGQTIKGDQDVALMKYDSAGNLLYTRTLGAANSATGLALAVAPDGKIAIAGSALGAIDPGVSGSDPTKTDSFVTVFDSQGQELWTQRRSTRENDQATAVAFGDDGTVYVAGQASSNMPGATEVGGQDGYLEAFSWNGKSGDKSKVTPLFTTQFGTTGADKVSSIAVSGSNVVVAGTDGPDAVVRQFTVNGAAPPTLVATRDLGNLQGGSIAGVGFDSNGQIVVAGTAHNGALSAGTVVKQSAGGSEAFVARLSNGVAPQAGDTIAYFGGSGDDTATGMAIQGTDVWLTGQVGSDLAGTTPVGTKDGYAARIDPATGNVEWVRRFTGDQAKGSPTSIAVDTSGSSALDRLGLPKGTLSYTDSTLLTSATSLRAGDQFFVRSREGGTPTAVTIAANDTLDTLKAKIQRASDFQATVSFSTLNGVRQLRISPINDRTTVEVLPGPAGKDAMGPLGLSAGIVKTLTASSGDTKKIYGLKLDPSMDISTPDGAKAAADAMLAAMSTIRAAYNALKTADEPAQTKNPGKTGGTAPTYLTNQIANYQAALDRLTGGSG